MNLPGFRYFSFRRQLTLVLVTLISLFAVAVGITTYWSFHTTLVHEGAASTQLAAHSASKMVQDRIARQQEQASAFLESLELNCALGGSINRSCARELVAKYRQETGAVGVSLHYRHSPPILAGLQAEPATTGTSFAFSTDGRHYLLSARNRDSGADVRTVFYDGSLIDLLPHFGPRGSGVTYLLDPSGKPVTLGRPEFAHSLDLSPVLAACHKQPEGELTLDDGKGHPTIVSFRSLDSMNGSCLLAQLETDDMLLPAQDLRQQIAGITSAFLAAAILLSLLMGRLLSRPLARLSRQIKSLRNKGLQPNLINVDSGPVEVKQLADVFADTMRQLKTAQEALRDSEAQLRERERLEAAATMASLLAHEVNNPLAAMTNTAYLLRFGSEAERQGLIELLNSDLERVSHIVRQILSLYRPNVRPQAIDFEQILHTLLDESRPGFMAKHIELITDIRPMPALLGFPGELKAAVGNLLSNALENVPFGGRVWVKAMPVTYLYGHHSAVRILIGNDGQGLSPDEIKRLFEPFTSRQGQGRGLGLWVSQIVVRKHEGEVRIRSGSGGKGIFVQVILPARTFLHARVG